jgi:pentatricopeptide repeat protein
LALSCSEIFWQRIVAKPINHYYFLKYLSALNQVLEWKLERILKEGIHDYKPYSTIIRLCGETKNAALAMRVFECLEAQGIQLTTCIFNALINAFLSIGDLLSAMTLYEAMEGKNCKPDSTTYDAFISAFSQLGSGHAMMNWYLAAKNAGFTPSIQAFESLITGFVRLNMLDEANMMLEEMISFEIKPNSTILEAKLEMLCRRNEADLVRDFVKCASNGNWELDDGMVRKLARTSLDGGDTNEMEELLALIQKGAHLSSETQAQLHSGIIKSYAQADRLIDMENAFCRMLDKGLVFMCPEDVEAVICCYFRHKDFDRLDCFLNRIQSLFKLTKPTYDILVAGYRRFGLQERLDSTINNMRKAGFA